MSQSSWLVAGIVPGIARHPLKKLAPDAAALLALLRRWQDEASQAACRITRIAVAYEAGRDGFWLARWLRARSIEAQVIHPTSVAVSREHRRAKTRSSRHELAQCVSGLVARRTRPLQHGGDSDAQLEDAKRPNREHQTLVGERTRIVNRMKGQLGPPRRAGIQANAAWRRRVSRGSSHARGRALAAQHARRVAAGHGASLRCQEQIKEIEVARRVRLAAMPDTGPHGAGCWRGSSGSASRRQTCWSTRSFRAICATEGRWHALPALPERRTKSGQRRRDKGLAKAGSARVRRGMIQLARAFCCSKGQRLGAMVPSAHRRCPFRNPQNHDRGPGAQAAHCAVADGDDW